MKKRTLRELEAIKEISTEALLSRARGPGLKSDYGRARGYRILHADKIKARRDKWKAYIAQLDAQERDKK